MLICQKKKKKTDSIHRSQIGSRRLMSVSSSTSYSSYQSVFFELWIDSCAYVFVENTNAICWTYWSCLADWWLVVIEILCWQIELVRCLYSPTSADDTHLYSVLSFFRMHFSNTADLKCSIFLRKWTHFQSWNFILHYIWCEVIIRLVEKNNQV